MKKVIFFASSYGIGLTALLTEQACSLVKSSDVKFLFISGEKEQMPGLFNTLDRHSVSYAKIFGLDDHRNLLGLIKIFSQYIDRFKPDIVHVQTNWQLAIAVAVKYLYRRKFSVFYTIHGYRHNFKVRSLIAKHMIGFSLVFFADKVIVTSSFLKDQFKILKKKIQILFLGVDTAFFAEYIPLAFSNSKRIIFPGAFREGKNQETLIRAIREYIDATGDKNVELYLPGTGRNLETCRSLSRKLGLEEKIFFPGFLNRQDMLKYYLKSQYVIVPTNIETFGLCIAEAFVLGRVVISRRVGVAEDVIVPGETGFLYNNDSELPKILSKILTDYEKCAYVSKNAFKKRHIFNWDAISKQYVKLLF